MSKVILALESFLLGVATTFLFLSGSHTFTWAQQPSNQIGIGSAATPIVPPISQHFTDFGISGGIMAFNVDGAECVRCVFNGPVLKYGGAIFSLRISLFPVPCALN